MTKTLLTEYFPIAENVKQYTDIEVSVLYYAGDGYYMRVSPVGRAVDNCIQIFTYGICNGIRLAILPCKRRSEKQTRLALITAERDKPDAINKVLAMNGLTLANPDSCGIN